jgi:hypothetical protein
VTPGKIIISYLREVMVSTQSYYSGVTTQGLLLRGYYSGVTTQGLLLRGYYSGVTTQG